MGATLAVRGLVAVCTLAVGQEAPREADLVLLQPYLNRSALGDGLDAYQVDGAVLVPLGELCRLLGFGITVNPARSAASGFFIQAKRTFALDLERGTVVVEGRKLPLGRTARLPRDLYVDARSLALWFPLEVEVHPKDSALALKALEKLPVQELWERDSKYGNRTLATFGAEDRGASGVPWRTPYAFLDLPMVDLSLGGVFAASPARATGAGSAALGGDLFWMSSDILAARDSGGSWSSSRGTLFREDPEGRMLGFLGARRLELGDLFASPAMELVGAMPQGRGLNLDNLPVTYRTRFSSQTFRGPLADGWSVEFFQNESLVGFQRSRADGFYEFRDVPLRFGVNLFTLVFHGPLGERIERKQRLDFSQMQPPPGTFYYSVSGVQPGRQSQRDLAGWDGLGAPAPEAVAKPSFMTQVTYGLSTALSVQAGAAGMHLADGAHVYGTAGLRGVWSFLGLQLTAAQDRGPGPKPGSAVGGVLSTGYKYSTLTLRRDQFADGFQRSTFGTTGLGVTGQVLKAASGADLNWSAKVGAAPVSITAQADREDYQSGAQGHRERLLFSTQAVGVTLSNSVTRLLLPGTPTPIQGAFMVNSFSGQVGLNTTLIYGAHQVNGWALMGQYNARVWQWQVGLRGPLGSPLTPGYTGPLQYNAGVTRMTGRFGVSLNVQHSAATTTANLQVLLSLGREPRTGRWASDAQSLAGTGSVSAVAFLDANGNGVRDAGEPILEGTRFKVAGGEVPSQIKDPKVTFITKLARAQAVDVSLDEASLEDASQKAAVRAYAVVPRRGKVARVEVPVTTFGAVNGTTRLLSDGKRTELGGLEVELLDARGVRVKVQRSAYDGFFEFTDLPYGAYVLRVTPEEVARMKIKPSQREIQIKASHNFLDGLDLVVEAQL